LANGIEKGAELRKYQDAVIENSSNIGMDMPFSIKRSKILK